MKSQNGTDYAQNYDVVGDRSESDDAQSHSS